MSLPEPWVDRIFSKLTLTYGAAFMRTYEGLEISEVKANWGEELSRFQQSPDALRYGLENLPHDRPPTVLQFRELCRQAPRSDFVALPAPTEPIAPEVVSQIRKVVDRTPVDPLGWANALRRREESGERLSLFQRRCWREALRVEERGE